MGNQDNNKYLVLTTKQEGYKNNFFNADDVVSQQAYIEANKHNDTYKTINQLKEPTTRAKDNFGYLVAFSLDFEASNHAFNISREDVIKLVDHLKKDFNVVIPQPTAITHSGRGFHVHYKIQESTDILKYQLVLKGLQTLIDKVVGTYDALTEVRHDSKVNYWSLIRVSGTFNTKAGVCANDVYTSNSIYTMDEIIQGYLNDLKHIQGNSIKKIAKEYHKRFRPFKKSFKGYNKGFTVDTLRSAVVSDLQAIQRMRNEEVVKVNGTYKYRTNEGNRNHMLFYYGLYQYYILNDTSALYDAMSAFNDNFKPEPLAKSELEATYRSIIGNRYATPSNKTIIKNIGIDPQEMQELKAIITINEKRQRDYQKRTLERQKKAIAKQKMIDDIKYQYMNDVTIEDLAEAYNVTTRTIYNYIKQPNKTL